MSILIETRDMHQVDEMRIEFTVTVYRDDTGELHYMAWLPGAGSHVGISSDTPYDAIRELCDMMDEAEQSPAPQAPQAGVGPDGA